MRLIDQVEERLSIFKNLYDVIRIIDPINKKIIAAKGNQEIKLTGACYGFWKKGSYCENCITMRSYLEDDTFVKIEYKDGKAYLVTVTPVIIEGNEYLVEILKDISKKGYIKDDSIDDLGRVESLICEVNDKIIKDELTGIYNRRYINERLPIDINNNAIKGQPLSIIMADIDLFKNVNDNYGHVVGDKILIDFAELLHSSIRENTDWVGRFGGEEFLIVLNNTNSEKAFIVAEKIRKQLENTKFKYNNISINITSSFGVYSLNNLKLDVETLISKVDKNLYRAKSSGRNKTVISV